MHDPWPKISSFSDVSTYAKYKNHQQITYDVKIKLHGTNAAIQHTKEGEILYQSRTRLLTVDDDNQGFALWASSYEHVWLSIPRGTTVYGEWCGPKLSNKVALAKIPHRIFAIFAIKQEDEIITYPLIIKQTLPEDLPSDVYILPLMDEIHINFNNEDLLIREISRLEDIVNAVEEEDPWVKETFGISGIGEGIVCYPVFFPDPRLFFKVKGTKHKVIKTRKLIPLDPEMVQSVDDFVEMFVTPERVNQAISEANPDLEMSKIGEYVKWILADITKESKSQRTCLDVPDSVLNKALSKKAVTLFLQKISFYA